MWFKIPPLAQIRRRTLPTLHICASRGVTLSELFKVDEIFTDVKSSDKTLMEKLRLLDTQEDKDKQSLYHIFDTFIAKKKLKDNLSTVLQEA